MISGLETLHFCGGQRYSKANMSDAAFIIHGYNLDLKRAAEHFLRFIGLHAIFELGPSTRPNRPSDTHTRQRQPCQSRPLGRPHI